MLIFTRGRGKTRSSQRNPPPSPPLLPTHVDFSLNVIDFVTQRLQIYHLGTGEKDGGAGGPDKRTGGSTLTATLSPPPGGSAL